MAATLRVMPVDTIESDKELNKLIQETSMDKLIIIDVHDGESVICRVFCSVLIISIIKCISYLIYLRCVYVYSSIYYNL